MILKVAAILADIITDDMTDIHVLKVITSFAEEEIVRIGNVEIGF